MLRSHWLGPVALVLASAGLARGQAWQAEPPAGGRKDRFVTVQEVGRPPLRCKLLKSWYEADGTRACQLQAVETGEMISTFVSATGEGAVPSATKGKALASRIVHWGSANHPPAGTPEAPPAATVHGLPVGERRLAPGETVLRPEPTTPYTAKAPTGGWSPAYSRETPPPKLKDAPPPPVQTVQVPAPSSAPVAAPEPKKEPQPAAALAPKPAAVVSTPSFPIYKPLTGPTTTFATQPTAHPAPIPAASPVPATVKLVPALTASAVPTVVKPVPAPTVSVPAPVVKPVPAVTEPMTVSKWAPVAPPPGASPYAPLAVTKSPTITSVAANATMPVQATEALPGKTADASKSTTADWRQSWGKVDQPKSSLLASAVPPPAPALKTTDPLQNPENYSKVSVDERINRKFKEKNVNDADKPAADVKSGSASGAPAGTTSSGAKPSKGITTASAVDTPSSRVATATPPPVPGPAPLAPPPRATMPVPIPEPPARLVPSPAPSKPPSKPLVVPPAPTIPPPAAPVSAERKPQVPPPPPVPSAAMSSVPAYITAAAAAANDRSGNAFSPAPAPTKAGTDADQNAPPPVSRMPGFVPEPGSRSVFAQIPPAPPVVAAAPTTAVVAAGFPVAAPTPAMPVVPVGALASEAGVSFNELLMTLHTSLYPSQREWAADRLTAVDWRAQPQVVVGLVLAAHNDAAPLVRAGCLRALARMRATCDPAITAAQELRNDGDARVRQEAEQTLRVLQTSAAPRRNVE